MSPSKKSPSSRESRVAEPPSPRIPPARRRPGLLLLMTLLLLAWLAFLLTLALRR